MKRINLFVLSVALLLVVSATQAQATIVNVDFNGANQGDLAPGPTYVGASAAGSGTVWNGVTVDSRTGVSGGNPGGTGNNYNLTISAIGLLADTGALTGLGLQFTHAGGDDNVTFGNALWRDYLGANFDSAGNTVPFTISGFGSATTANLYFYHQFDGNSFAPLNITIGTETPVPYSTSGIFTSSNTLFFQNVPVTGGSINGTLTLQAGYDVLNGFTAQFVPVPEPSSFILCGLGALGLFVVARRRRKA